MNLRYSLAAAIALAATPADAQEGSPLDSSVTDTVAFARWRDMTDSLKTVITAQRDSISGRLDSARASLRRAAKKAGTERSGRWAKPTGSIEAGGTYGAVPFALQNGNPWNAYAKGRLGLDVLGAPLSVSFDLGTDLPIRGQRNKISIGFDPARAALNSRWSDAHRLHESQAKLDSLEAGQAQAQRALEGAKARLQAELVRRVETEAKRLRRTVADSSAAKIQAGRNRAEESGADVRTRSNRAQRAAQDSMSAIEPPTATDNAARNIDQQQSRLDSAAAGIERQEQRIDSLTKAVDAQERKLLEAQERVAEARKVTDRSKALTRSGMEKAPLAQRIAQGLKRFQLGTCTPEGSEFLINGTTLQGLSFSYAHKDLFIAVDHGRTLDDAARDAAPIAGRLRQLHQSLFLADAADLNPRKLTDLRVGYGTVEGTHAHLGFLRGTRHDHPAGSQAPPDEAYAMRNLVAELDAGVEVKGGHLARIVYARSATERLKTAGNDGGSEEGGALFSGQPRAEAVKLSWASEFRRIGTRIAIEGRSISPAFQSYGVGFLRSGSRAGELRLDQQFGERWRLKAKGSLEERQVPSTGPLRAMLLQRAQLGVQARVLRTLSCQATYAPVVAAWRNGEGPRTVNRNCTVGATLRERWRATVISLNATTGLYQWTSGSDHGAAWNHTASITASLGERWSFGGQWMQLRPAANDTLAAASNLGAQAAYRSAKGFTIDATVQQPDDGAPAWLIEVRQPVRKGMAIGARTQRFAAYPQVQGGDALTPVVSDQAHSLFFTLQW